MGYAIFGSSFFTALNDGLTSALISFLRTLVFQVAAVLLLPLVFGIDGIWYSIIVAELMAMMLSAAFVVAKRNKYHYL
jgi:Na+-driven multidrug efflux pump